MGRRFGARASDDCSVGGPAPGAPRQHPRGGIDALQRMAALVEFSEDPIIGLTLDGLVTDWNPAAERLYGYSAEEMLGASVAVLVPPELHGRTGNLLGKVAAGEAIKQLDTQRMAKGGRRIDVSISMTPIKNAAGAIVGAAAFTRDITERRRIESELQRLNAGSSTKPAAIPSPASGTGSGWKKISSPTTRAASDTAIPTACCCATSIASRR